MTDRKLPSFRRCLLPLLAVLLVAPLPGAQGDEAEPQKTYNLCPNFKQGQTARYSAWTLHQISESMTFGPRTKSSKTRLEIEAELVWQVKQVNEDGSAECDLTIEWITVSAQRGDGPVKVNDSRQATGEIEQYHQLLLAIAGKPMTFQVTADGTIESITGTDEMRQAMGEDSSEPKDLDLIESATDMALLAAAPQTIEPGGQWNAQFQWLHRTGKINHDYTFTLDQVSPIAGVPIAIVSAEASLDLEPDLSLFADDAPHPQVQMTEGAVKSQVMFDLSRHEAVGRNTVQTHTIEVNQDIGDLTLNMVTKERIQGQVLRIAEQ